MADAEGRLQDLASSIHTSGSASGSVRSGVYGRTSPADVPSLWVKDKSSTMDTVKEEDEDQSAFNPKSSFKIGPPPDQASSSRAAMPVYPASLRSASPVESQMAKPLPPRPSIRSGDDTYSGNSQPIIDEIASALREWHTLMFQHLARRDYKLFMIVRDHIDALHLGRRQLLAQTLSAEETETMRRECVKRLVVGNLVQGLDVIVRHPTWGSLVSVDVEGEVDPRSWVSAVRMYSMQVSLAYLNVAYEEPRPFNLTSASVPLPTPAHSAFPDIPPRPKPRPRSALYLEDSKHTAKFYHVFIELRAFMASPCVPGETAELYFSLYKKQGTQFVTEEFCAILNHNGTLLRDPNSKIRTLFVDLAVSDIQDPIHLVCRIVRNGTLRLSNSLTSPTTETGKRASAASGQTGQSDPASITSDFTAGLTTTSSIPLTGRTDSTNAIDVSHVRRPFGCAVLELTQLKAAEPTDVSPLKEHSMPIYVPTNEISFSMIHQNIINNNTREYEKSSRAESIAVSVKVFRGNLRTIVRENTSLLQDTPQTLRLGFPDVVFPGDARNELYVKLWGGDFSSSVGTGRLNVSQFARGQMSHPLVNVQIMVEVRDSLGNVVENVISQGTGEPPVSQYHSMVFLRCNEPTFGELIKIQVPIDEFPQWHLFFTFRNRTTHKLGSDKPFAFAFQPLLLDATTFVEDGSHTLIMYKADKYSQVAPSLYLSTPSRCLAGQKLDQHSFPPEMLRLAPPLRDTLTIRSSLCSTKHTQNPVLQRLLTWESLGHDNELISTLLGKFTFVGEGEIVKFLRDIFDALFGILVSPHNMTGELDLAVFNALVTVLGIVQDRRFSNFQPVLDVYIEEHFNCPTAPSHIIHSLNRLISNPTASESASHLRAALKVWHYIFKFIARARELQKARDPGMGGVATADYLETSFKRELRSHLSGITQMMSSSTPPAIIGTQTIALQHFTSILPELAKIFSTVELVAIVTNFANAVLSNRGKIVIWKLIMYLQLVKGFLFDIPAARPLLVESMVVWLKPHFGRYDEFTYSTSYDAESARDADRVNWLESIRLSVTVIAVMLDKLQQSLTNPDVVADRKAYRQEQDNVECLLSLLPKYFYFFFQE